MEYTWKSRWRINFTIIIWNSLSGRFPISSSFVWFGGHLSCSFTCWVFLCLFILFKLLSLGCPFCTLEVCGYMEFRKMVTITLYTRQQKRQWCIEQSFGLCGRERGWDDLGEWHWNMYNIIYEMNRQSRFNTWYWMLGAGALGRPRGMVWGGRRDEGSGWRTHVHLWQIHFDIWQNQYNIVKFKNKIKLKKT